MIDNGIWRIAPGYSRYLVDEYGSAVIAETQEPVKWHKSNGYVFATLVNDDGVRLSVGQHRLVALAYIEMPNVTEKITVNHKDGVKSNNHFTNLEWATYSSNILHAYQTGLRKDRIPVIATHVTTGEQIRFFSKGECARYFGVRASILSTKVGDRRRHRFKEYSLEFLIEESEYSKIDPYPSGVTARDISTGKVFVADNMADLSKITGVCPKVIKRVITGKRFQFPVNGFDFRAVDGFISWPNYNEAEINAYSGMKFIHNPVVITHPCGKEELVGSVLKASAISKTTERNIRYRLKDGLECANGFKYRKYTREISVNS